MPKKRKTRQQKMVTDQKRQGGHQMTLPADSSASLSPTQTQENITFSLPTTDDTKKEIVKRTTKTEAIAITTNDYGYLKNDLLKTAFLTCAIIIAELIIRFMFRG